jgi:hypothetical protein
MKKSSTDRGVQLSDMTRLVGRQTRVVAPVGETCDPFIISTTSGKPDAAARKLIRSQVMRGKNRTKPLSIPVKQGAWIEEGAANRNRHVQLLGPGLELSGTGLSIVKFADEMQPYMLDLVFKCKHSREPIPPQYTLTPTVFTILGQALFPIEMCLNLDLRNTIWLEYMYSDAICLQSTLWATQSYFDWVSRSGPSKQSMLHESKTLVLLHRRLAQGGHEPISDSTIAVVVIHVLIPALVGDLKTAIAHMVGLSRMVSMRGGVSALHNNIHLQIKICRADLCIAVATNRPPLFFSRTDVNWGRILAVTDDERWALPAELSALLGDLKLANLWADLKCFAALANVAFQTDRKLKPELFQEMLTSVMYRATLLKVSSQSVLRALHLSMLAFGVTVFLQAQGAKVRFEHLSMQLREVACAADDDDERNAMQDFNLWSLIVTGLSAVTEEDDEWLLPRLSTQIQNNGVASWEEVRSTLKKYLWIDAIHDKNGKALYHRALIESPWKNLTTNLGVRTKGWNTCCVDVEAPRTRE